MIYHICPHTNQTKFFLEKYSQSRIPYYTARQMRELYPRWGFVIIGEIGNFAKPFEAHDMLLESAGKAIPIFPRGSMVRPFEWVAGYIAVGENTYISAIKSIFPKCLRSLMGKHLK